MVLFSKTDKDKDIVICANKNIWAGLLRYVDDIPASFSKGRNRINLI